MEIKKELREKIEKYVKDGRYKSVDEFMNAAAETLLMAEDRKKEFEKILGVLKNH